MSIVEDYAAIAKRLRTLRAGPSANSDANVTGLERRRGLARAAVRIYIENRRRRARGKPILPRRF